MKHSLYSFYLQIKEPVVKEINNKETKIAFDKVDVPTFVGFFEEENEGKLQSFCQIYANHFLKINHGTWYLG